LPLPPQLVAAASPFQATLLPAWLDTAREISFGNWNRLSLAPLSTRAGLVTLVAHATLFLVTVQWLRNWQQVERLLRWIALAAVAMAAIGLAQYISRTEKFAWLFIHPSREAHDVLSGPFANSNHFSHFLALGIGPLLWWLHKSWGDQSTGSKSTTGGARKSAQYTQFVFAAAIALISVSGLLARSRGGMLVMFLAGVLAMFLFARKQLLSKKSLLVMVTVGALVAAALTIHGKQQVASELSSLTSISLDQIDRRESRRRIWKANLEAARHFSICGTGVGSHVEIYRRFFPHSTNLEYTHAESGYLQVLTETGLPGLGLLLIALGTCGVWSWKLLTRLDRRRYAAGVAVATGLAASAVHSAFDFVWYLPACMSVTILLAACACRMLQWLSMDGDRKEASLPMFSLSQSKWSGITVIAIAVFVAMAAWQWPAAYASPAWNRYQRLSSSAAPITTFSDDPWTSANDSRTKSYRAMARELETTLRRYPQHPRANIRLASIRLRLFEETQLRSVNAMGLASIRDAAIASRFPSRKALDKWLKAALGDNRLLLDQALQNARVGISGCPILGKGYIYLAQLAFLEGISDAGTEQLLSQANCVRPFDGAVLYAIGQDAALRGDVQKTLSFWKRSFHQDSEFRNAIINTMAAGMPVTDFLLHFEPDELALKSLLQFYNASNQVEKTRVVAGFLADYAAQHAQDTMGTISTRHWMYATYLYRLADDDPKCLECAQMAVSNSPFSVKARRTLALELYRQNDWERAIRELKWCLRRQPSDEQMQRVLASATRTGRQANNANPETSSR
jgi:O-antigen ligase/tetratricopeptide (TPR) repeat protein